MSKTLERMGIQIKIWSAALKEMLMIDQHQSQYTRL